jgi:hypothetical protein
MTDQSIEDASRREFEADLQKRVSNLTPEILLERRADGKYASLLSQYSWEAWQAARQSSQSEPVDKKTVIEAGKAVGLIDWATTSDVLKMAAKVVEENVGYFYTENGRGEEQEELASDLANQIRNLITHPESTAPQQAIPSGWKLVPIEPTAEMMAAGRTSDGHTLNSDAVYAVYKAMINAAPIESDK